MDGYDKAKKYSAAEIVAKNYNLDLCKYPNEEEEILPPHDLILQYQEKRAALNADIDRVLANIEKILNNEPITEIIDIIAELEAMKDSKQ